MALSKSLALGSGINVSYWRIRAFTINRNKTAITDFSAFVDEQSRIEGKEQVELSRNISNKIIHLTDEEYNTVMQTLYMAAKRQECFSGAIDLDPDEWGTV